MSKSTKSPEQKASDLLHKAGWQKIVILGVKGGHMRAVWDKEMPPIEMVGLMECMKMTTVRSIPMPENEPWPT